MKTKLSAVFMILFCTLLVSAAQIFYKLGVPKLEWDLLKIITNYHLLIGIALYAIGAVILIIALKGGEVTILYPIIATSYIWVSILSMVVLGESMNFYKWLGVFVIVAGVVCVGLGSKPKEAEAYAGVVE